MHESHIDALVKARAAAQARAEQDKAAQAAQARADRNALKVADLRKRFINEINDEQFIKDLHPKFQISDRLSEDTPEVLITYMEIDWYIVLSVEPTSIKSNWYIIKYHKGSENSAANGSKMAKGGKLKETLLELFVEHQPVYERWKAFEESQEQALQENKRKAAQAKADELLKKAQAQDEHATVLAIIAARTKERHDAMWTWPEGANMTIYQVSFGPDETHKEMGYTLTDTLNKEGYVYMQETIDDWPREMKIDEVPYRYWQRIRITCANDIPSDLREPVILSIEGIATRNNTYDHEQGISIADPCPGLFYRTDDLEEKVARKIGWEPMEWIKALAVK